MEKLKECLHQMQQQKKSFTKLRTVDGTDFMRVTLTHCGDDYIRFLGTISTGTIEKEFIIPYSSIQFLMD